jgi:hypothetical protein
MDRTSMYAVAVMLTCGAFTGAACSQGGPEPAPGGSDPINNGANTGTGSDGVTTPGAAGAPGTTTGSGPTGSAAGSPPPSGGSPPAAGAGGSPGKSPPPPGKCAIAATGDWTGHTSFFSAGSAGGPTLSADVRWTLAASEGCVDHYVPTGTASFETTSGVCTHVIDPPSAPINPATDGHLIIDRTTSPATYTMEGKTTWAGSDTCSTEPPNPGTIGGVWASNHGTFDGSVLSGEIFNDHVIAGVVDNTIWEFTRVDAVFTPPAPGACSEPAIDHWSGTASAAIIASISQTPRSTSASLVWTRVSTTGCVDRFEPSGTATVADNDCTTTPATHAVAASDGILEIDRSVDPPKFSMTGESHWSGSETCPVSGGGTSTFTGQIGGVWAPQYNGVFDGNAFSASAMFQSFPQFQWSLKRMP